MSNAQAETQTGEIPWHQTLLEVWKENDVALASYVPDTVLRPLIEGVHADPFFRSFPPHARRRRWASSRARRWPA